MAEDFENGKVFSVFVWDPAPGRSQDLALKVLRLQLGFMNHLVQELNLILRDLVALIRCITS